MSMDATQHMAEEQGRHGIVGGSLACILAESNMTAGGALHTCSSCSSNPCHIGARRETGV